MIQPKDLYRELAALLANINDRSGEDDFLFSVLMKLENSFARDLHISNGRLYIEDLDRFLPVKPPDWLETSDSDGVIALDTEAVQHIMRNGSYIFNNPSALINNQTAEQGEYVIAAAFTVRNPENRWIIVFTLQSGWVREEVEFCLNAVRALLNFRLQSDAMKNDMQQAALIQQSLLPSSPPQIAGYETAGRSCPAEVVGGDFFDFSIFGDDVFSVAIGDASGHGLPAALLVRDVVTGLRMGVEKEMKMSEAMQKLNRVIHRSTLSAMQKLNRVIHRSTLSARFISLFYAEIERNCNIFYVNAGHPPPFLVHGTQVTQLKATGTILGAVSEISLQRAFTCFEPGAVLVMYSDGLLERLNNDDEEFGLARLTKLIVQNQYRDAQEILDIIHQTIFAFGAESKWQDDITVVVIKKK
jgi:sigma-B regulation protein RsbU (phosphoserine phosphatase)